MKRHEHQIPDVPAVGSSVRMRFGVYEVVALVIEHRGPLGVGGRQIIRVRFKFEGAAEQIAPEVPAEAVTVVDPAA